MSQKPWEMKMSALVMEAANGLRKLAGPRQYDDSIKTAISRAANRAGLSYWRAYDLWYRKARRIDAGELDAIRAADRTSQQEARDEFIRLAADFLAAAERASSVHPTLDGPHVNAMRDMARRARDLVERARS